MTTKRNIFAACLLCFLAMLGSHTVSAQLKYGFKTGLNFARFSGQSELDDAGNSLEKFDNVTGFHIGMTFGYGFTDRFGARGEFMYSKRGAKYTFEGQSFRKFAHPNGSVLTTGNARYLINVNNSYLDVPVVLYGRFGHFEVSGGAYVGVLVASSGEGSLRYTGTPVGLSKTPVYVFPDPTKTDLSFNLNHNYRRDKAGEGTGPDSEEPVFLRADGIAIEMPRTLGAYYDHPEGKQRLYNALDYGLVGGVSYYVSRALYVTARVQYGLADITNNKSDLSKARTESNGDLIFREDKDRNFVIQASVGFSF